jgi:anaerobic selenocysteine-containing dehydrogenase
MTEWLKSACVLCAQNCGLEMKIEEGRLVKVRPDKTHGRSKGYICRKGVNVAYHQYSKGRLTEPLKRVGERFEPISWTQAIDEISDKLSSLLERHGPRCLAYMASGAQGGHFEVSFGLSLLRALGSQYYYSSAGQEFSGIFWVQGRMMGKQYIVHIPDEENTEMLVAWGWNGMESHQIPRAPKVLKAFAKDPERLLVVVDPRKSPTAALADHHLAVRPGADALLLKAMISIIIDNHLENDAYLREHVDNWDRVKPWFESFDSKAACAVCELGYEEVKELCHLMTTRKWSVHPDLGVFMGRQSTLTSYLMNILGAVCGVFCEPGGNVIPGMVMPLGFHADERNPKTWRGVATDMPPAAAGAFPPAIMPEEILNDHPERLRAVLVSSSNPLRSFPDTTAYEEAFKELELLVVTDIVMSETAKLAHYVLPSTTYYESWDGSFFPGTYPGVYFQMRRPVLEPSPECRETGYVYTCLAEKLGIVPDIPKTLHKAAQGNRLAFGLELMEWISKEPQVLPAMPFVLAKTLGEEWGSYHLALLWGLLNAAPKQFRRNAARAGFAPGPDQGDRIFQAILDNPQGIWIGKVDTEKTGRASRQSPGASMS